MGPGDTVGQALQEHPGIDGIVFTGSYEVGMDLFRAFSKAWPRPCIVEMGGKNPAIVSRNADLDEAAEGIMRSAFGFGGQKCSANSRVYVERPVHDELVRLLVEKTEAITIGDPLVRANWLGPIIDQTAVDRHQAAVSEARRDGTVFVGGERLSDSGMERGYFVEPTVVGNLPASHRLFRDELFAPFTAVAAVDSLDEAIDLANDSVYGLTAGVYSEDQAEVQRFLDRIQAGVAVRQPAGRRDDRGVAGHPGVRRLEGQRLDRQGRAVDVLRRAVPPRAVPHHRRLARRARRRGVRVCAPRSRTLGCARSGARRRPWPRPPCADAARGELMPRARISRAVVQTACRVADDGLIGHHAGIVTARDRPSRSGPRRRPARSADHGLGAAAIRRPDGPDIGLRGSDRGGSDARPRGQASPSVRGTTSRPRWSRCASAAGSVRRLGHAPSSRSMERDDDSSR